MRLPSFKRINKKDYPSDIGDTIDKLSFSINDAVEGILNALNGNLSITDNQRSTILTLTVSTDVNGFPLQAIKGRLTGNTKVVGTSVIYAKNVDNSSAFVTGQPFCSVTQAQDILTVDRIAGLPANVNFSIKLLVYQE